MYWKERKREQPLLYRPIKELRARNFTLLRCTGQIHRLEDRSCSAVKLALKFALKIVHIMFDASQVSDFSLDLAQLAVKFFL